MAGKNRSKDKVIATVYPLEDPEVWAKRYEINNRPEKCLKCKKLLFPTIPFADKDWRGLKSKPHKCGPEYDLWVMVPIDPKRRQRLREICRFIASQ